MTGGCSFESYKTLKNGVLPFAGWFNLLGQVSITAGIDFALTNQIGAMWVLSNDYILTQGQLLAIYTGAASHPLPLLQHFGI